ncbi:hypothetical protein B0T20DRAFT_186782 [Sordaria brevicollis]|uniref:Uncharacterized protein n=1 Tax=Sordaria brevicollis TaxID=83679 RepID=A0AAE0PFF7_SORBR|nr:hypothetical protein B0T20DRAFT_186782 [Sordaria brevicollis]
MPAMAIMGFCPFFAGSATGESAKGQGSEIAETCWVPCWSRKRLLLPPKCPQNGPVFGGRGHPPCRWHQEHERHVGRRARRDGSRSGDPFRAAAPLVSLLRRRATGEGQESGRRDRGEHAAHPIISQVAGGRDQEGACRDGCCEGGCDLRGHVVPNFGISFHLRAHALLVHVVWVCRGRVWEWVWVWYGDGVVPLPEVIIVVQPAPRCSFQCFLVFLPSLPVSSLHRLLSCFFLPWLFIRFIFPLTNPACWRHIEKRN